MKNYNFEFLDPAEGIWNCLCVINNVNKIKVENINIGYSRFVKIIINDLIEVFYEGEFIKDSLILLKGSDKND